VVDGDLARWPEEVKRGRILHADAIIATPKRKQELFEESGAVAVDMESQYVRSLAERAKVPFLAVRAISDEAHEAIEPAVLGLVDPMGVAKPGAIFKTLTRRPMLIPTLIRLRAQSNFALERLALALPRVIGHALNNR
jgi:adenosylhomocysteine nucleosidase